MKKMKINTFILLLLLTVGFRGMAQTEDEHYIIKTISINDELSNFGTSFYGDDKLIFASPTKRNYIINNVWKPNNQPFLDLCIGTITAEGDLKNVKKFSSKLNTKFHEADVTFTKDRKTVYFTRSNYYKGKYGKDSLGINRLKMFKASVGVNDEWIDIKPLPFNNDNYSVGHPALSEDEKTLYFVSDMPGTLGKTDIFKVSVHTDGTYGKPVNLGPEINTPEKEMFPFILGNDELYFSSNGRKDGMGMLDVYVCKLFPGRKPLPINLGTIINSDKDDFAFIIAKNKREGYFSSNREGGKGDDDIYYFKEKKPFEFACDQDVTIVIKNKKTGDIIPHAIVSIYHNDKIIADSVKTDANGKYFFKATCNDKYKITAGNKFFLSSFKTIETNTEKSLKDVVIALEPNEFVVVREKLMVNLNPIYFNYDKFAIREDAAVELDKVVTIMKKYPKLIIEVGSHTDSRGSDSYNEILSDKRANSTVAYIVSKGISKDRISGKGYGEKKIINKCTNGIKCSKEEHQLNRRTEFVIVNPEVIN